MASSRKRRHSEMDNSGLFQRRHTGETRRRSVGDSLHRYRETRNQRARDQWTRDKRVHDDRRASDKWARDKRVHNDRRARDRRACGRRTPNQSLHDRWERDSSNVRPKRRRTTSGRVEKSREEEGQIEYQPLGYKALEEICNSNSPENAMLELEIKRERFEALLSFKEEIRLGVMQLIIRALHLCCSTKSLPHLSEQLLRLVIETNFLRLHLSTFISRMLLISTSKEEFHPSDVIWQLADVFLEMLKRFRLEIVHYLPVAQLDDTFVELKSRRLLRNTASIENKVGRVKALQKEVIRHELESAYVQENQSELEPPSNFRDLSVIPQTADLSIGSKPFLRVNVVNRCYRDLEHYLDVQYRLLREDFVSPLREGIMQLRKGHGSLVTSGASEKKVKDVNVYRDVTVLYPVCSGKGMVYRIQFNPFHHSVKHVNWRKSKRLKFGSLLCLSAAADDFYTPLIATVENRDTWDLCRGELEVRFENVDLEELNHFIEVKEKLDMVESPAFFEAYRHVLEALKEIEPPDGLPFQEHLVQCSQNVGPPEYELKTNGYYNMSCIIQDEENDGSSLAANAGKFPPETTGSTFLDSADNIDDDMVSSEGSATSDQPVLFDVYNLRHCRERFEFNDSQLRAFQLALTKRFAVIQGPPGTGKTYVGLKIAQVLLQTTSLWEDEDERAPILMVSYTNHALDQFLEGLLPMSGNRIIRVGGRFKSEKLEPCSLKFLREQARESKETPGRIARARRKARKKMREISENGLLELSATVLKFLRRGVLSFHVLKQFMSEGHVKWFESDKEKSAIDVFCEWLGVQRSLAREDVEEGDDEDDFHNEDFQMQVSLRTFANEDDVEEDEESSAIMPSQVIICDAEETNKPAELRESLQDEEVTSEEEEKQAVFPQWLTQQQRWKLYRLWLKRTEKHYLHQLQSNQPDYEKALARLSELTREEDFHVLQKARVIGMTTTCAARYRSILQRINPRIVLVEEAAEVLEAHIITSLTKGCQHLILIGDHQQLKPTPAVYELAKKYKLDVSLFERMVNVGIQSERLCVQHRMRPEIASLMRHIYDDLENHESVEQHEDIKGMKKNMFFINHKYLEKSSAESHSHTNEYEATFLVALCRYLLQQGYKAEQITLLTTYTGQMFFIKDCLRGENDQAFRRVRLTTVDNFQGEENDIILLSLVRSNKNEKVGFIKIENRACVALSRAKKGFYCVGNLTLLSKHSDIWRKIVEDLKARGSIGNALPLKCQIHRSEVFVKRAKDFKDKVPHGGCLRPCKVRLQCGHSCKKLCHPYDVEHEQYRCRETCHRTIKGCTHLCRKLCCEKCDTYCTVIVQKKLPFCGHVADVCCGKDADRVECKRPCEKNLPCGHRCQGKCGKPCTKRCQELVKRSDWPCKHEVTVACSATPADCPVPCGITIACGHLCSGTCGECRMGRVHKRCKLKCGRVLVCSHTCMEACVMPCPPCSRPCENRCVHSECKPKKCGEPCVPCLEFCPWECRHYKCTKLCGELCNRQRCNEPCLKTLSCGSRRNGHFCRGLCGEPCICAVCHTNDGSRITEIFFGTEDEEDTLFVRLPDCNHIFAVMELDKYMDSPDDTSADGQVIQLKRCPRCNTPIRTSLRYGDVIKQQLRDIEKVKIAAHGHPSEMGQTKERLQARLTQLKNISNGENTVNDLQRLERSVSRIAKGTMAVVTENQVTLMERYCGMSQRLNECLLCEPKGKININIRQEGSAVQTELEFLRKRFMSAGVTERELRDINVELTRQKLQLELCLLRHDMCRLRLNLKRCFVDVMEAVCQELTSGRVIEERRLGEMLAQLGGIRQKYRCLSPLTAEENKEIVSAVSLSQGRWYKCPQGHVYSIGGCGEAMQRSTCPKCRAVIGGTRHQLFEGNMRAPELDDSRSPRRRFGRRRRITDKENALSRKT